jgi:hypothetical protein
VDERQTPGYWEAAYGRVGKLDDLTWCDTRVPADCLAHPLVQTAREAAKARIEAAADDDAQETMQAALDNYHAQHSPVPNDSDEDDYDDEMTGAEVIGEEQGQ